MKMRQSIFTALWFGGTDRKSLRSSKSKADGEGRAILVGTVPEDMRKTVGRENPSNDLKCFYP